jgi:hypothetical protein
MLKTYQLYQTFDGSKIRRDAMFYGKDSKFYNLKQAEEAFAGEMYCESLEEAFEKSNMGEGPKGAYSMSVGDILVNKKTGRTYIVARVGFDELYKWAYGKEAA